MSNLMKIRKLTIDDVLRDDSVTVDGMPLDSHVTVIIRQVADNDLEIDYFRMRDIYFHSPVGLIKLDQDALKNSYKSLIRRFENACELKALEAAKATPDSKWTYAEEVGA